jgi:dimethylargininase
VFRYAITRKPAATFSDGLTTSNLGKPDLAITLKQHEAYCSALQQCGLDVTILEADPRYPDSTFVEDTAVLTSKSAVITNPGANSRKGEVTEIRAALSRFHNKMFTITPPGTVDGGDICEAGCRFFIGISARTNEEGGRQLAELLAKEGYGTVYVDIRGMEHLLHLKSGIAYLGDDTLVLVEALAGRSEFKAYHIIRVKPKENYAANCVQINDYVLIAEGFPQLKKAIEMRGYKVLPLSMSEFQKMDGGLSCLSLRF